MSIPFFSCCYNALMEAELSQKIQQTNELFHKLQQAPATIDFTSHRQIKSIAKPGAPAAPELVSPLAVPKRSVSSKHGHASLIHALAHIEFNAINLALAACYQFQNMPQEYYHDWLTVAYEEALHFTLLDQHLHSLGFKYGDFSAHNGLWDMAYKTEHDVLIRMALVPRVLEARGIDAIPNMQAKLLHQGDERASEILEIIKRDEIKHVTIGDKWFKYCCHERKLEPRTTFFELFAKYDAPKIRGPFNREGRRQAGFSPEELEQLANL